LLSLFACQEFVAVAPPDFQITDKTVFQDEETARAAMAGLFVEMAQNPDFTNSATQVLTGLSADELITNGVDYIEFENNDLQPNNPILKDRLWRPGYRFIYRANTILEGLENSPAIGEDLKNQLLGEASFIRAYCLWHLTNLFGQTPIILTTDLEYNATVKRASVNEVYNIIESDLINARLLLTKDTFSDRAAYLRPTYWAATALLARVCLFKMQWDKAERMASEVVDEGAAYFMLEELHSVFGINSREAIWQVRQVVPGLGTWDALAFVPGQGVPHLQISPNLLSAFETGDERKYVWLDSIAATDNHTYYYPHKYKFLNTVQEHHVELRLAEVYLIRAEARANLERLADGTADLNRVRARAGLPEIDDGTKITLLNAIAAEKRVEFFAEGHRWYDLKRWNEADALPDVASYKDWQATDRLYPVPQSEIDVNNNLLPQNDGYN
jgi:hypothetical protein